MDWDDALDALHAHPHIWRLRQLCESEDPETREGYRALVVALATGRPGPPGPAAAPPRPPVGAMVRSAIAAAIRFARSGFALAGALEVHRRRRICAGCPAFDAAASRCRRCGCSLALKPWSRAESCPDGRW